MPTITTNKQYIEQHQKELKHRERPQKARATTTTGAAAKEAKQISYGKATTATAIAFHNKCIHQNNDGKSKNFRLAST
jgi:phosphopantetheinyl transferase